MSSLGKEINVSINKKKIGKGIKIGEGGFGKVYKITKIKKNGILEHLEQPFVQKQTNIFDDEGELIGQNLKEIFIGLNYFKNENTQSYQDVSVFEDLDDIDSSYFGINMTLADMTFYDLSILPFTNQQRINLFFPLFNQIIKGLSYIHSKCVCHCDIKPENILVYNFYKPNQKDNREKLPKIFSISQLNEYYENAKNTTLKINDYSGVNLEYNNTMDKVSTMCYRPPELFQDTHSKFKKSIKHKFGPFNDIWSVGIIMLEFLYRENIIDFLCKNVKKQYKIKDSKTAMVKLFNCVKSINVSSLLKLKGYDINNEEIKHISSIIQSMICINIDERINLNSISMNMNFYTNCPKDVENVKENLDISLINKEFRKKAIQELEKFIKDDCEETDREYLPLGILLFDRICCKDYFNEQRFNTRHMENLYKIHMFYCYYIACKILLSDIYIDTVVDYIYEDVDNAKCSIMEILEFVKFDVYRPTILTFLFNENDDRYHTEETIKTAIDIYCKCNEINTDNEKSLDELIVRLNSCNENFKINDEINIDIENLNCITYVNYEKTYKIHINDKFKKPSLLRDNY
jgi:serine/threonine protein kinase